MIQGECEHSKDLAPVVPQADGCVECLKTGERWVQLRLCLTCGHVGCCDSSKNKHATKHFHKFQHPVIEAFKVEDTWRYCYLDDVYLE